MKEIQISIILKVFELKSKYENDVVSLLVVSHKLVPLNSNIGAANDKLRV